MRNPRNRRTARTRRNRLQSTPRAKRARVQYGRLSTAAINSVGKELQSLQRALESGEIDTDEFEYRMEELESRSRAGRRAVVLHRARIAQISKEAGPYRPAPAEHAGAFELVRQAYAVTAQAEKRLEADRQHFEVDGNESAHDLVDEARAYTWDAMNGLSDALSSLTELKSVHEMRQTPSQMALSTSKNAAVAPADVALLHSVLERLGEAQDPDAAARMLHDIVDAASEMARELGA